MEVTKVLINGYDICFIIKEIDGDGYYNWIFSIAYWVDYWMERNKSVVLMREIYKCYADMFLNDPKNDTIGVSEGSFETIEDCMNDFFNLGRG